MATSLHRRETFLKNSSVDGFWYYYWNCRRKGEPHFLRGLTQCGGKDGPHLGEGKVALFGGEMPPHFGGKSHPIWGGNAPPFGVEMSPHLGGNAPPFGRKRAPNFWVEMHLSLEEIVDQLWREKCTFAADWVF